MCAARPRQGRDTNRASPQSSRDRIGAKCCRAAIARVAAVHGAPRTHPSSVVRIAGIALGWIGATTLVCFRCQERADEMWFWERSATLQGPVSRDVRNREAPPVGRLCAARHHSQAQNLTVIITVPRRYQGLMAPSARFGERRRWSRASHHPGARSNWAYPCQVGHA